MKESEVKRMDELKRLFNQVVQQKLDEFKAKASTYGEAKKLAQSLAWSAKRPENQADRLEMFIGEEIQRLLNEELESLKIQK